MVEDANAKVLTDLLRRHAKEQNEALAKIQSTEQSEEYEKIKAMIARTMGAIYTDALYWLYQEHPELKPPEML